MCAVLEMLPRRKHIFPRQFSCRRGQGRERIDRKGKCLIFPHTLPWNLALSAGTALSFESRWAAVQLSGRLLAPHPLPPPCSFFSTAQEKHSGKRIPAHCILLSAIGCICGSGSSSGSPADQSLWCQNNSENQLSPRNLALSWLACLSWPCLFLFSPHPHPREAGLKILEMGELVP